MNRKHFQSFALAGCLVAVLALLPACDLSSTASTGVTPIPAASPTTGSTATPAIQPTVGAAATDTPAPAPTETPAPPTAPAVAASPTPAPATPGAGGTQPPYLDDRSSPQALLMSYANAVNRHEYLRAYGCWEANTPGRSSRPTRSSCRAMPIPLRSRSRWARSRAMRARARLYYNVPAILTAQTTGGVTQTFAGCYTLHLSQPAIQGAPPFQPLGIQKATVQPVANDAKSGGLAGPGLPGARRLAARADAAGGQSHEHRGLALLGRPQHARVCGGVLLQRHQSP